jgi:tetratricopeptide (TPR) repeat protein
MASGADGINAEYLARLLREDYEGSDNGVIEMEIEEKERSYEFIYMPAGADGPKDNMEGAEEVAPEPIRTPETEPAAAPPKVDSNELPELTIDDGTPIPEREELEASEKEESLGLDDNPEAEAGEALETPAEEEEGWGIQDWLDASVDQREDKEIDLMIDMAEERLRIDPDDPEALGILAYYQYLDESFDEATSTFDRLIDLFPDESFGYNNKALVYKRQKLYRKEEGLYRIALALNPEDTTALNNLAVNLGHQRRFDEALHYMKILEAATPDDAYADLHRAKIYAEMGDEELALTFLERALKGMKNLDTLHHIEFRQDIRVDPSFQSLRDSERFRAILFRYYGDDSPLPE